MVTNNMKKFICFSLFVLCFALSSVITTQAQEISPEAAEKIIAARAKKVIRAIKNKDMETLSTFAHPTKGVRFAPYAYIETDAHLVFKSAKLKTLATDKKRYNWGSYDAADGNIRLTFNRYYKRFIYDKDFANAPSIGYNEILSGGNTPFNASEVYPQAITVEYYFPNSPEEQMNWRSLRLLFEKKNGTWYLVAIVHSEWTI